MSGLLSPWVKKKRLQKAAKFLQDRKKLLDVGCGFGELLSCLPEDIQYIGIDKSPAYLKKAKRNFPSRTFFCLDIEKAHLPNLSADGIALLALLEHLKNPEEVLAKLKAVLEDEGILVITTPHPRGEKVHPFLAKFHLLSPLAVEDHETFFSPQQLASLFHRLNFTVTHQETFLGGLNQLFVLQK